MINQNKDIEICPLCGSKNVISLDCDNNVFSCNDSHYWKYNEAGESLVLRKLSPSEVSVKLNMLSNQYKEELSQLFKMDELLGVDLVFLDELRVAQLEMVRDGELMVFLRPDNSVMYVLTSLTPNIQSKNSDGIAS